MDANQKALLAEAVNALIDDSDASDLYKKMNLTYELICKGVPVRLVGRAAILNPLLDLLIDDLPAGERVLQLIDRKRTEGNQESLDEGEGGFDRKSYMRELMATKRERQRRLVDLVNALRSENTKLKGSPRLEFERIHAARWLNVRTEREDALREKLGRRLTVEERTNIIKQLWVEVDQELDELEAFVLEEIKKPVFRRAPEGFKFKLQPKKGNT